MKVAFKLKSPDWQKITAKLLLFTFVTSLVTPLLTAFSTPVKADSFYPSADTSECNFAMATSVSYRGLPANSSAPGGLSYNTGQLNGESGNYPATHRITNVADITFPDAHRYRGVADGVAVPPNTTIDVGFYVHNYSNHTITAHNGYLFTSRANTANGDWGRLGAGGNYVNISTTYGGNTSVRSGRAVQTGNIGTYPDNPISNPPLGRTIYSFTTIQPIQIQSRTGTPEFLGGGNLRIRYDLTVRNVSQYTLPNVNVLDNLPSGEVFNQTVTFNPGQTRTFTYYANMGSSYPTVITNDPVVVSDPNSHREEAAVASNSILSSDPETRTLIVERDDAGAPAGWTGRQPDFSAYPNGDYFYIVLIPYATRSDNTTVNVPPNLIVEKVVSDPDETRVESNDARPAQDITYDISVRNTGGNATGVTVVDNYDQNLIEILDADGGTDNGDTITWNVGNLNNQESRTFTIQARTTAPLAHGTYQAPNTATADSDQTNPVNDSTQTNITAEVRMEISKTVTDSDETDVSANHIQGGNPDNAQRRMTYTVNIRNGGDADATGVRLVDNISEVLRYGTVSNISNGGTASSSIDGAGNITGQIVWNIGNLPQGESRTVTFDVYFNPGIGDLTLVNNTATVETNEVPDISDSTQTTIHSPVLDITKDDGVTSAEPGQTIHWVINVRNTGTGNAYNVEVYDIVPDRMTVSNISDDGAWRQADRTIIWSTTEPQYILNGSFNPDPRSTWGQSKTLSFDALLDPVFPVGTTNLNNVAITETDNYPSDRAEHNLPVVALPINDIEKYVLNETARDEGRPQSGNGISNPDYGADADTIFNSTDDVFAISGDVLKYTLTYRNTGNAHSPDTVVRDHLPRYITDENGNQFEIIQPEDIFDISDDITVVQTASGYDIIWQVGELQVGQEWKIKEFRVRLNSDSSIDFSNDIAQRLINNVSEIISSHPEVLPDTDNAVVQVNQPIAEITKGSDKLEYQSSERIIYSFTVVNNGSAKATGVIKDELPEGLEFESSSYDANKTHVNGRNLEFDVSLNPSEQLTISVTVKILTPIVDLTRFNNEVRYEYRDENENNRPTVNDDVEVLIHAPNLEIEKTQDLPDTVAPGQLITYTIKFRNTGSGIAPNVLASDLVPEHTQFVEFVQGQYEGDYDQESKRLTWDIGSLDPQEEGEVSFSVVIVIPTVTGTEIKNIGVIDSSVTEEISSEVITATTSSCCMSGSIWDDANKNGLREDSENSIANVKILISWQESEHLPENTVEVYTDQNGNYGYNGLPYFIPINVKVLLPEGFDNFTTDREFTLVLLPPREDGVKEDYVRDGIRYLTAGDCISFLNAGIYRDIVIAKTGYSPVIPLILGVSLIAIGTTVIGLILIKRKRKP